MTEGKYFALLLCGDKRFELRRNDRGFRERDVLVLKEIGDEGEPTGWCVVSEVKCVVTSGDGPWLCPGHVALGLGFLYRFRELGEARNLAEKLARSGPDEEADR